MPDDLQEALEEIRAEQERRAAAQPAPGPQPKPIMEEADVGSLLERVRAEQERFTVDQRLEVEQPEIPQPELAMESWGETSRLASQATPGPSASELSRVAPEDAPITALETPEDFQDWRLKNAWVAYNQDSKAFIDWWNESFTGGFYGQAKTGKKAKTFEDARLGLMEWAQDDYNRMKFTPEINALRTRAEQAKWRLKGEFDAGEYVRRKGFWDKVPFIGTAKGIGEKLAMADAARELELADEGKIELSEAQVFANLSFLEEMTALEREAEVRGLAWTETVAEGAAQSVSFMLEMMATGGTKKALQEGIERGGTKFLTKYWGRKGAEKIMQKTITRAALRGMGPLLRPAMFLPQAGEAILEEFGARAQLDRVTGELTFSNDYTEDIGKRTAQAILRPYIAIMAEEAGEVLGPAIKKAGGGLWSAIPGNKAFTERVTGLLPKFLKAEGIDPATWMGKLWNTALKNRAAYNGFVGELGEEVLENFMLAVTGAEDFDLPDSENNVWMRTLTAADVSIRELPTTAAVIGLIGLGFGGTRRVLTGWARKSHQAYVRESLSDPYYQREMIQLMPSGMTEFANLPVDESGVPDREELRLWMLRNKLDLGPDDEIKDEQLVQMHRNTREAAKIAGFAVKPVQVVRPSVEEETEAPPAAPVERTEARGEAISPPEVSEAVPAEAAPTEAPKAPVPATPEEEAAAQETKRAEREQRVTDKLKSQIGQSLDELIARSPDKEAAGKTRARIEKAMETAVANAETPKAGWAALRRIKKAAAAAIEQNFGLRELATGIKEEMAAYEKPGGVTPEAVMKAQQRTNVKIAKIQAEYAEELDPKIRHSKIKAAQAAAAPVRRAAAASDVRAVAEIIDKAETPEQVGFAVSQLQESLRHGLWTEEAARLRKQAEKQAEKNEKQTRKMKRAENQEKARIFSNELAFLTYGAKDLDADYEVLALRRLAKVKGPKSLAAAAEYVAELHRKNGERRLAEGPSIVATMKQAEAAKDRAYTEGTREHKRLVKDLTAAIQRHVEIDKQGAAIEIMSKAETPADFRNAAQAIYRLVQQGRAETLKAGKIKVVREVTDLVRLLNERAKGVRAGAREVSAEWRLHMDETLKQRLKNQKFAAEFVRDLVPPKERGAFINLILRAGAEDVNRAAMMMIHYRAQKNNIKRVAAALDLSKPHWGVPGVEGYGKAVARLVEKINLGALAGKAFATLQRQASSKEWSQPLSPEEVAGMNDVALEMYNDVLALVLEKVDEKGNPIPVSEWASLEIAALSNALQTLQFQAKEGGKVWAEGRKQNMADMVQKGKDSLETSMPAAEAEFTPKKRAFDLITKKPVTIEEGKKPGWLHGMWRKAQKSFVVAGRMGKYFAVLEQACADAQSNANLLNRQTREQIADVIIDAAGAKNDVELRKWLTSCSWDAAVEWLGNHATRSAMEGLSEKGMAEAYKRAVKRDPGGMLNLLTPTIGGEKVPLTFAEYLDLYLLLTQSESREFYEKGGGLRIQRESRRYQRVFGSDVDTVEKALADPTKHAEFAQRLEWDAGELRESATRSASSRPGWNALGAEAKEAAIEARIKEIKESQAAKLLRSDEAQAVIDEAPEALKKIADGIRSVIGPTSALGQKVNRTAGRLTGAKPLWRDDYWMIRRYLEHGEVEVFEDDIFRDVELTNVQYLKQRKQGTSDIVIGDAFSKASDYVRKMSLYAEMGEATTAFKRLLNNTEISNGIADRFGQDTNEYMKEWFKDFSSFRWTGHNELETGLGKLRRQITVAKLMARLHIGLNQIWSGLLYGAVTVPEHDDLKAKHVAAGWAKGLGLALTKGVKGSAFNEQWAEIMEVCPNFNSRMTGSAANVATALGPRESALTLVMGPQFSGQDLLMGFIRRGDMAGWSTGYFAAKAQMREANPKLAEDARLWAPKDQQKLRRWAESMARRTQPAMDAIDHDGIARYGRRNVFASMFTMFHNFRSVLFNLTLQTAQDRRTGTISTGQVVGRLLMIQGVQNAMYQVVQEVRRRGFRGFGRSDEEPKGFLDHFLAWMGNTLGTVYGGQAAQEIIRAAAAGIRGDWYKARSHFNTPIVEWGATIPLGIYHMGQAIDEWKNTHPETEEEQAEHDEKMRKLAIQIANDANEFMTGWKGFDAKPFLQYGLGAYRTATGQPEMTEDEIVRRLKGVVRKVPDTETTDARAARVKKEQNAVRRLKNLGVPRERLEDAWAGYSGSLQSGGDARFANLIRLLEEYDY